MHGSDTCTTKIGICIFLHACAFCILSNMVTRNEIVNIVAFMDDNRNLFMFFDRQKNVIRQSFEPNRAEIFQTSENLFRKVFVPTGEVRGLRYHFCVVMLSLVKKYPEWILSSHTTLPVPTIESRVLENVRILPFCQRKGTNRSCEYATESFKDTNGVISS